MQIRLHEVSLRYGHLAALDSISLTIEPGQIVALLGSNGAGKTSLLRALSGIVAPEGHIFYDDQMFYRGATALRRRLAFLPDFPVYFVKSTVLQHIGMVAQLYGLEHTRDLENRVLDLLRGFDLLPLIETPMGQLSRGQVYKAGLAAFLAVQPELLLLDEPLASGMDPPGLKFAKGELRRLANAGRTVLFTTQILDIAEKIADRVCVIERGQVRYFRSVIETQREMDAASGGSRDGALERLFENLREQDEA